MMQQRQRAWDGQQWAGQAGEMIEAFCQTVRKAQPLALDDLPADKTALVVVDMVNGFVKGGPMSSPRVEAINSGVAALAQACGRRGIIRLALADCHEGNSPEFAAYPPHCLQGSWEAQLTQELAGRVDEVIAKGSTNGAIEPAFARFLQEHAQLDTFLVVGDCTDICVQQFALTLKAQFTRANRPCRVVVAEDLTATFTLPGHDGDVMQAVACYMMAAGGVEIVSTVTGLEQA